MFRPRSQHLRCGTTPSVVSTRAPYQTELQSPCSVPQTHAHQHTCILAYLENTCITSIVFLQCTSDMPAYRFLIVQFPTDEASNFCELEVYIRRKFIYQHDALSRCMGSETAVLFLYTGYGKKVAPKVFCRFLSNRLEF